MKLEREQPNTSTNVAWLLLKMLICSIQLILWVIKTLSFLS